VLLDLLSKVHKFQATDSIAMRGGYEGSQAVPGEHARPNRQ